MPLKNSQIKKLLQQLLRNKKVRDFLRRPKGIMVSLLVVVALTVVGINPGEYLGNTGGSISSSTSGSSAPRKGPYELAGLISHVSDGDTVHLTVNGVKERIRLANIDAPESQGRADRPGQPYAKESTQALERMVSNKNITLHCFEQDHYGRHVCNIPYGGSTANELLVAQGLAWAYTGSNERYLRDKNLKQVQAQAKKEKKGLWQQRKPIAPWDWRRDCWNNKQCN